MQGLKNRRMAISFMLICFLLALFLGGWRGVRRSYEQVVNAYEQGTTQEPSASEYIDIIQVRSGYMMELAKQYELDIKQLETIHAKWKALSHVNAEEATLFEELQREEAVLYEALKACELNEDERAYLERDHTMFVSATYALTHHHYNEAAHTFQEEMLQFPAVLFQKLYHYGDVPVFD